MTKQFSLRYTLFLFLSDLILAVVALYLASQVRDIIPLGKSLGSRPTAWTLPWPIYVATVGIWATTFVTLNVYLPQQVMQLRMELVKVVEAAIFAWMILAGVLYLSFREVSRLQFIYFLGLYILLIIAYRITVRIVLLSRGSYRSDTRRVLIVGTGEIANMLADLVQSHGWMGLELEGFVSDDGGTPVVSRPMLGQLDETLRIVEQKNIDEVLIALPRDDFHQTRELIYRLQALPVNIRLVPDYFDMVFLCLDFENFSGIPLLSLKEPVLDPFQRLTKRGFDLCVTLLILLPALPVMGVIALMIRLDSPGPVLFRQKRVGERGHLFTMLKFRTMCQNAEQFQADINLVDDEGNLIHKHEDDPRVTRIGGFLRRTSLDELPQLFNIIRGEMSLVGPRPEMPWLVDMYEPWQRKRFEVPQGLTGWWQVNGRSDKPMHLHTEDDLYYIQHYSLLLDVRIIWRTIRAVLLGNGAY
jgi:exopolysaccharide biosynthesis polyprenyl glycosylphosphotransferase